VNLNANIIKEHTTKLQDFEARLNSLQDKYDQMG